MRVGDIVQIKNMGSMYTTYEKYFSLLCPEYLDGYRMAMLKTQEREHRARNGDLAKVMFVHNHTVFTDVELSVIELLDCPGQYYLIGSNGLQIIDCDINVNYEIDVSYEDILGLLG